MDGGSGRDRRLRTHEETPSAWGAYLVADYALEESAALAKATASRAQFVADASAQKVAELAEATATRDYWRAVALATWTESSALAASEESFIVSVASAGGTRDSDAAELAFQRGEARVDVNLPALCCRTTNYELAAATALELIYDCELSLVGVTDVVVRESAERALRSALDALWRAETSASFTEEVELYGRTVNSVESFSLKALELDKIYNLTVLDALEESWQEEATVATTASLALESAENGYDAAVFAADVALETSRIATETTAAEAYAFADKTLATAKHSLTSTTLQRECAAYFTALSSACSEIADTALGGYFTSLVAAAQTAFSTQTTAANALETTAITKEEELTDAFVTLSARCLTAALAADSAYANLQLRSHSEQMAAALANEKAAIEIEVEFYRSVCNAEYAKLASDVETTASATRRQLAFTQAYGDFLLTTSWNSSDPRYAFFYETLPGLDRRLPTFDVASPEALGVNSSVLLAKIPVALPLPLPNAPSPPDYWSFFNAINASVSAVATETSRRQYDYAVADAWRVFVASSSANYSTGLAEELAGARSELASSISASTARNEALLTALDTANASYRAALGNATLSAPFETCQNAFSASDLTFVSSVAAAFGTFQVGIRAERLSGITQSNARYSAYSADVAWATQTKSLRDQYYTELVDSASAYASSTSAALKNYRVSALTTELAASASAFNAEKAYSRSVQSVEDVWALAQFDAFQTQTTARATATFAEATANAAAEKALAHERAERYAQALVEVMAEISDARLGGEPSFVVLKGADDVGVSLDALEALAQSVVAKASAASKAFSSEALADANVYSYYQERIDLFNGTVSADVFSTPTFDYEVCFVAGTPVLMADGSTKPIERLRPGDFVLAADHLAPESAPTSAKVVRFFDNGEKPVVKLVFES